MDIRKLIKSNIKNANEHEDDPLVIFDVGCRWGFAERFINLENAEKIQVYGFDPDRDECQRLQESYKNLPKGMVACVPVALAGKEGVRNLYVTKQPACSSLHPPIQFLAENYPTLGDDIKVEKIISIDVTTLDKWTYKNNVEMIDYIKIDTQGSELEILQGGESILNSVRCVDVEVEFNPIYEGASVFSEVDIYLRSRGFSLWRLSSQAHYSLGGNTIKLGEVDLVHHDHGNRQETEAYGGQLFWGDARYIRNDVLHSRNASPGRVRRDIKLFNMLGMVDIIQHIESNDMKQ